MARDLSPRVARMEEREEKNPPWLRNVDVNEFLEALDIANIFQSKADEVGFSCPFPGHSHGDERPSCFMNTGERQSFKATFWFCFGCKRRGNAIDFLAAHEHINRALAAKQIKERFAPGFIAPRHGLKRELEERWARRTEDVRDIPIIPWDTYHKRFGVEWGYYAEMYGDEPDVGYMLNRGFTPAMLEEWAIGYDADSERITIPVADADGNLVGIKARAWKHDVKNKYISLGDTLRTERRHGKVYGFEPYEKTLVVFGLDKWGEQPSFVFCEGEIDVMSFWRVDIPAFCTGGSWMSEVQAKIIRQYTDEVVMFFDNDSAGSAGLWGYVDEDGDYHPGAVEMLEKFIRVKIAPKHMLDANVLMRNGKHKRMHELIAAARPALLAQRRQSVL
jgi:DNA primase